MYKALNNQLKREANKVRDQWWKGRCSKMEKLNEKGRVDLL